MKGGCPLDNSLLTMGTSVNQPRSADLQALFVGEDAYRNPIDWEGARRVTPHPQALVTDWIYV